MSFFLVDDGFSSHEKVGRLLEAVRPDRAQVRFAALALWVLAGSECARRRNGGRVSRILARTLLCTTGRQATQAADALVEVGLWDRDGDGYVFHDWADRQRPRDKHPVSSAPAAGPQLADSTPAARPQDADSTPVERQQDASSTPVGRHSPPTIPSTCDPTPLSSLLSPLSSSGEREASAPVRGPDPTERMLRSLVAPTARDAEVVRVVSERRLAAGGAKFRAVSHTDRDAVSKLREWADDQPAPETALVAVLDAFFAAKGAGARLSWLVEEEPGRFLGTPRASPRGPAPATSHAEFERQVKKHGGAEHGFAEIPFL